jgi:hypothetical protein
LLYIRRRGRRKAVILGRKKRAFVQGAPKSFLRPGLFWLDKFARG